MKKTITFLTLCALSYTTVPCTRGEEGAFPRFDSHVVCDGAWDTWKNYVQSFNAEGKPVDFTGEISPELWAGPIRELKPKYVYAYGVNIVVVRSRREDVEEGIYVALGIASGPGPNDEQFTRMLIAHEPGGVVHTFRRKRRFERVPVAGEKGSAAPDGAAGPGR
jgi:hypothetical protein